MMSRSKYLQCLASVLLILALLLPPGSTMAAASSAWHSAAIQQIPEVWVDDDFTDQTPGWGETHFNTIQDGVDAVMAGGTVHVAEGTYIEQVVITRDVTLQGAGTGSVIKAFESMPTCFTTSYDHHPVVCVKDGAIATIDGFTIDGDGKGDTNYRFVGIAFRNAGGEVKNSEIKGIRDAVFSGAQHGVGIYVYNDDTTPYTVSVLDNHIFDFQKNAMALNAGDTTPLTIEVRENVITGNGPTTVTAQNGIQVWADLGSGVIADNTITGIGYDNTNSQTPWVATSILNFYADLEIVGNTISEAQMGIYNIDGSSLIHDNELSIDKVGVSGYGIIATDPPDAVPDPYDPILAGARANSLMSTTILDIEIADNTLLLQDHTPYPSLETIGIEADAGYGENDIALSIHHNNVEGFDSAILINQCDPTLEEGCTQSVFTSIDVISNNLYNHNYGLVLGQGVTAEIQFQFNRIYKDPNLDGNIGIGVLNPSLSLIHAENNWWGCNGGPLLMGTAYNGCVQLDLPTGVEYVNVAPWLILTLNPLSPIAVGQTAQISAELLHVDGGGLSSGGVIIDGIEIGFVATNGWIDPAIGVTVNGVAPTTYHAPDTGGEEMICASLDGEWYVCQQFNVYDEALQLTDLRLMISSNGTDWQDVPGSFTGGFEQVLDPSVEFYYLDTADLVTTHPLKDGLYPFYFDQVPDGFFEYWAGRGVVEGATGWQGVMWEIINKDLPVFYLEVAGTEYDLIDGLQYALGQTDARLRIDGGYLPGAYSFSGAVEDIHGFSAPVTVNVAFYDPLALTGLDLLVSSDQVTWENVSGSLLTGFDLALDTSIQFYYLDAENVVSNRPLADGYNAFYVDTYPDGYFDYWAGRGVVEGATGWQSAMWEIINGREPIFYLKVSGTEFDLIDGLQYLLGQGDQLLRIDGTYLPGAYTFAGQVMDDHGFSESLTVSITFNDIPVVADQVVQTSEDTKVEITLSVSDLYHPDGLTWVVGDPQHGTLSGTAPDLVYTPDAGWHGTDSFTYQVSDGVDLQSNKATVTITVNSVDDDPAAADDAYSTDEDKSLTVDAPGVLGNDTDVDGDGLTAVLVSGPAHGTLTLNIDGSFTYVPEANWYGTDSFTYQVSDGSGPLSNVATVTITVKPVNDAPKAVALPNVEWLARQAHTLVIPAFTDTDGDELTYTAELEDGSDLPAWLSFDPATRTFTAAPTNAHAGQYQIKVTASDGLEQVSASFTLKVILNPFIYYMPIIGR